MARKSRAMSRRLSPRNLARSRSALLRPPEKTCREQARDFIWDREKKMCFTRTPLNWLAVAIYYAIFLGIVMLIFLISNKIAEVATDQDYGPQYVLDESPIGPTPTLNFFPLNGSQNLIWLSQHRPYDDYVKIITKEFEDYKKVNDSFNPKDFGECANSPYGYDTRNPCIYFRLNRLILWQPIPYHRGDRLPKEMPKIVRERIHEASIPKVWMSCEGTTAKDRDHLPAGNFHIQGSEGFNILGYPFERQPDYIDPIVAIKIIHPNTTKVLLSVTCYPWSRKMDFIRGSVQLVFYFE